MKNRIISAIIATIFAIFISSAAFAQNPPPPPEDPSGGGGPVGGGTPVGSGLIILIALGAAYGGKKIYQMRKND